MSNQHVAKGYMINTYNVIVTKEYNVIMTKTYFNTKQNPRITFWYLVKKGDLLSPCN